MPKRNAARPKKEQETNCKVFRTFCLNLFYRYEVEVSGNKGVRDIGQHTVHFDHCLYFCLTAIQTK